MKVLVAVMVVVGLFALGFRLLKAIRVMVRTGRAYVAFDVKRLLLGKTDDVAKELDAFGFWFTIAINALCAAMLISAFLVAAVILGADLVLLVIPRE